MKLTPRRSKTEGIPGVACNDLLGGFSSFKRWRQILRFENLLYLGYHSFKLFNYCFLVFAVRMLQFHTFLLKVNNEFFRVHSFCGANPPNVQSSGTRDQTA